MRNGGFPYIVDSDGFGLSVFNVEHAVLQDLETRLARPIEVEQEKMGVTLPFRDAPSVRLLRPRRCRPRCA